MIRLDVKELGRIPDGVHRERGCNEHGLGYDYLHTAIDDRSRLACIESQPPPISQLTPRTSRR